MYPLHNNKHEKNKNKENVYAGKNLNGKKDALVDKPPKPKDNPNSSIHKMKPKNDQRIVSHPWAATPGIVSHPQCHKK